MTTLERKQRLHRAAWFYLGCLAQLSPKDKRDFSDMMSECHSKTIAYLEEHEGVDPEKSAMIAWNVEEHLYFEIQGVADDCDKGAEWAFEMQGRG